MRNSAVCPATTPFAMILRLTQRSERHCFCKSAEEFEPGQSIEPIIVPKSAPGRLTLSTLLCQRNQQAKLRGLRPTAGNEPDRKRQFAYPPPWQPRTVCAPRVFGGAFKSETMKMWNRL